MKLNNAFFTLSVPVTNQYFCRCSALGSISHVSRQPTWTHTHKKSSRLNAQSSTNAPGRWRLRERHDAQSVWPAAGHARSTLTGNEPPGRFHESAAAAAADADAAGAAGPELSDDEWPAQ